VQTCALPISCQHREHRDERQADAHALGFLAYLARLDREQIDERDADLRQAPQHGWFPCITGSDITAPLVTCVSPASPPRSPRPGLSASLSAASPRWCVRDCPPLPRPCP